MFKHIKNKLAITDFLNIINVIMNIAYHGNWKNNYYFNFKQFDLFDLL